MYDLIVTKNRALVVYLIKSKIVDSDIPVKSWVTIADVAEKHVIGKLPHKLSCAALSYTEIPLHLPPHLAGQRLIVADYDKYADAPVSYRVTQAHTFSRK